MVNGLNRKGLEYMTKQDEKTANAVTAVLSTIALFAVSPFVLMFVWNTLVTHMFGAFTIGYGGAWALMVLKTMLPRMRAQKQTAEESLQGVINSYAQNILIVIATLIVGLSIGAL